MVVACWGNQMLDSYTQYLCDLFPEVDSLIINKTLFDEYNVPIPTDYESFIAACEAFEAVGIRGFVTDFKADYTCMETLQGISISALQSIEGRKWRQQYESGATNQLSEEVWLPVFEKFFDFKEKVGLGAEDAAYSNAEVDALFTAGKAAMFRGTGVDVITFPGRGEDEVLLMPHFGQTEKDNWYLTYPAFQIAASKKGMDDPEREKLILDILTAMVSQDGQEHITAGKNMVPYNKDVTLELLPEHGNQAASAVANTMRKLSGCDLVLLQGCYVASDIYAGDHSQKDLGYLAYNSGNPGLMELTGEQVYAFVETTLSLTDGRGAVCNDSTLYVSSGFEMDITKTDSGYTLNALTIDGKEMDRNKTYSFMAYGDVNWYLNLVTEKLGISEVDTTGPRMPEYLTQRLVEEGGQLEAPTDYIILR